MATNSGRGALGRTPVVNGPTSSGHPAATGRRAARRRLGALVVVVGAIGAGAGLGAVVPAVAGASGSSGATEAKHDLLALSDFPKGWKVTHSTSTSTSASKTTKKTVRAIASCEGVSAARIDTSAPTASSTFSDTKAAEVATENVVVFPSTAMAKAAFKLFSSTTAPSCVGAQFAESASHTSSSGITSSKITTARLAFPKVGAASTALKVTFPISTSGQTITIEGAFVVIRQGKVLGLLAVISLPTRFPTSFSHSLAKKAAGLLH